MTQDTERWTIYVCPECGSLSGVEQPCPDVAHAYADEAPPIVERYVPASALQEVERERDELREALRKIADGEKVTKPHGEPRDGVQYVTFLTPRQIARAALSNPKEEQ